MSSVMEDLEVLGREVGKFNPVRVWKTSDIRPDQFSRAVKRIEEIEADSGVVTLGGLVMLEAVALKRGLERPKYIDDLYEIVGGELLDFSLNLRTNVGIDYVADSLGKSASRPAVAEYIALTENGTAPAAGDTTLTAEIATNGLARAIATYAHTGSATSYTMTKTFTASGAFTTVQKAGLFNAASVGTMALENTFTSTALAINDQITITWTINI